MEGLFLVTAVEYNDEDNQEDDHEEEGEDDPEHSTWFTCSRSSRVTLTNRQLKQCVPKIGAVTLEI